MTGQGSASPDGAEWTLRICFDDAVGRPYLEAYGDCARPMLEMDVVDALARELAEYGELHSSGALLTADRCTSIWRAGSEIALRITTRRDQIVVESVGKVTPDISLDDLDLGEYEKGLAARKDAGDKGGGEASD